MATRRRYTARQKAEAVGIAVVEGVTEAERQTGIPKTTIQYWSDQPKFAQLRTKSADVVAEEMWAAIQAGMARMIELLPQTDDISKVGVALGILYDKRALLTGGATGRWESRELNDLPDSTYVAAINEAKRLVEPARPDGEAEKEPAG
jgi:transposase-like protein